MMNKQLFLCLMVCLGMVFISAGVNKVHAATIHVVTTEDNVPRSLRTAIRAACNNEEDTTIILPAGTYILGGEAGEDRCLSGDLDITTDYHITITGAGAATTVVDGNGNDRVFHILQGTVSISGVTITNGKTPNGTRDNKNADHGGGIYNEGDLTLSDCFVTDNAAGNGYFGYVSISERIPSGCGGYGGGIYNTGTLHLSTCMVSNNEAGDGGSGPFPGGGGHGGGIYNRGTQTLINCSIIDNSGGNGTYDGDDQSNYSGSGGNGGGIYNRGVQSLSNCLIQNNTTGFSGFALTGSGSGGGIFNVLGEGTLSDCTITNNCTGESYYGRGGGDGGGISNSSELTLTNCTVSHNYTTDTQDETYGGGISNGGTLTLINSTISHNYTGNGEEGADGGSGGGIHNNYGTLTLESCTICNNFTGSGSVGYYREGVDGSGGGIFIKSGMVNIKNTIVADNQVAEGGEGPDCWGTLNSQGYNLIENTNSCIINGDLTGNITGVDPMLGTLADNGGPTQTHALLPGSPAIDAGTNSGVVYDQREHVRPVDMPGIPNAGNGTDIGAYEFDTSYTVSGRITYAGTGLAGVTLTFSNNGGTATSNADGDYSHDVLYGWTGTVTPSTSGYAFAPTSRSYTVVTGAQTAQDFTAVPTVPPTLWINRAQIIFGADTAGNQTSAQTFLIANSGGGILNWTISDDANWLNCTPVSGTESAIITAAVDPAGLTAGTYYGTITVDASGALNSPGTISVTLVVYDPDDTGSPFGCFETPPGGVTLSGSVPVSGWVLDDIGVEHVKIYRQENSILVYVGDALFVEGARPDVEAAYPGFPENSRAGWGYMMLTNFLPNGGNGTFTFHAVATDREGHQATLGTRTVTCDNANAVKPFGAIDTPAQGGTASGGSYRNHGWALTPPPNEIPGNGSTIAVYVDGVKLGNPVYNVYRSDVANLFPGYANSDGAGAYFDFDTTDYDNGVHTIYWTAVDDAGNADGIGSRYFTVQNSGNPRRGTYEGEQGLDNTPLSFAPVAVKKGYDKNVEPAVCSPGENGMINIEIRELERLELQLTPDARHLTRITGYHVTGEQLRPLPIGSTLDSERGIFYWVPGPGFLGTHQLLFVEAGPNGELNRWFVDIKIVPKFSRFRDIK